MTVFLNKAHKYINKYIHTYIHILISTKFTSSLRWKMSMPSGMGKHRAAMTFMKVDLPQPFRPM